MGTVEDATREMVVDFIVIRIDKEIFMDFLFVSERKVMVLKALRNIKKISSRLSEIQ